MGDCDVESGSGAAEKPMRPTTTTVARNEVGWVLSRLLLLSLLLAMLHNWSPCPDSDARINASLLHRASYT